MDTFVPTARVLADSVSDNSPARLTSMEVTGHRFILAELNTHRVFSRNSASSRAIPYATMRKKAIATAFPVEWRAEQKGMQGGDFLEGSATRAAMDEWHAAALSAVHHADQLHEIGVHKSIINRLLEPFIPHTAIISSTEWDGFWAQRCHPDAQPEIRVLAEEMRKAYDASEPTFVPHGSWHTPLIEPQDEQAAWELDPVDGDILLRNVSVARCARVSYLTHDGVRDIRKDIELYDKLRNHLPAHASPFEHVATPVGKHFQRVSGNFVGWRQLRHLEGLG